AVQGICAGTGVSQVAAYRLAEGWTLATAARLLAELRPPSGRTNAITVQMVCAWERGRVMPSVANVELLCQLYRTRADRLGLLRDYTHLAEEAGESAAPLDDPADRVLAQLRAGGLRPTPQLVASLASVRQSVEGLLQPSAPDPGDLEEAAGWYRTGRVAAYRSGDRILESWVTIHHAFSLLLRDQPEAALAQARAAQAVAGTERCSTALWGPELEARALARLDLSQEALAAARRAEDVCARGYPSIQTD